MRVNFRTLNNNLLNRIAKAKGKEARTKLLNKYYKNYTKQMSKNSLSFFRNNKLASERFNKYTLNTIFEKISNHIDKEKFDPKILKKQLANIVRNSRNYQKQVKVIDNNIEVINKFGDDYLWKYVITHPIATEHSKECAQDLRNSPFTKDEAIEVMKRKPNHVNCRCHIVRGSKIKKSRILIEQGNI